MKLAIHVLGAAAGSLFLRPAVPAGRNTAKKPKICRLSFPFFFQVVFLIGFATLPAAHAQQLEGLTVLRVTHEPAVSGERALGDAELSAATTLHTGEPYSARAVGESI